MDDTEGRGLAGYTNYVSQNDITYRRELSQDIAAQWEDGASIPARSLSGLPSPETQSGGWFQRKCRKCELADDLFLCPESRIFWNKVPHGDCCKRMWRDFLDTLKREFPKEEGLVMKRVTQMLKTLIGSGFKDICEITIDDYLRFIRFFGPFRLENTRCAAIKQLKELVQNSSVLSRTKGIRLCWFAGYMNRSKAAGKLKKQDKQPGTFLIRMSVTCEDDGCFAVSVVMKDGTIEHFQIKGHPEEAVTTFPFSQELEFQGERFTSLPDLVNNYLRHRTLVSDQENPHNSVICSTVCPDLPFMSIVNGYK